MRIGMLVAVAAAAVLGAAGCTHSNVDAHWGQAYREIFARQVDDPEGAARNAGEPGPMGYDGTTAQNAMTNRRKAEAGTGGSRMPLPMIVTDTQSASGLR